MTRQYISDVITIDEIKKWVPGNRILICSMTGSGKSSMIKNQLYDYAKSINKQILLMSNRSLLKKQNEFDLKDKLDFITLENYQSFESKILKGTDDIKSLFEPYYFICEDEIHYGFSDSAFNQNTDLLLRHLKDTPKDKIFLFLTATPEVLLDYQPDFDYVYNLPRDYSYIKTVYFYDKNSKKNEKAIEAIIRNIPKNEKVLYFGSSVKDIYNLFLKFEDSAFICSDGNKLKDKSDKKVLESIEQESFFEPHILFATKVLDNGVNIKDDALKHVIIDTYDFVSFIQMLGRKRSMHPDDKINLYVKSYHKGQLSYIIKGIDKKLKDMERTEIIINNNLEGQYPEYSFNKDGTADPKINIAKYQHYKTQKRILQKIMDNKNEDAFARYICKLLGKDIRYTKDAFMEFEKLSLKEIVERYVGVKMFQDTQTTFKNMFFSTIFTAKKMDYSSRGIQTINNILEEDGLDYILYSKRETSGSRRNKAYWLMTRKSK
jgi:superfamily II DNA or RNA helicase